MVIGVIPARLESTRFPRKILFPICNKPMVVHVYERAVRSSKIDEVIVAIDAMESTEVLKDYGIPFVMTSVDHQSGTDRIAEAVLNINAEIIINIQADEPMIEPGMLDDLVSAFDDKTVKMATLASTVIATNDLANPNLVKVSIDKNHFAKGFYRNIEDYSKKYFHHIGIYGYRKDVLTTFTQMEQSTNEKEFHLEQLRALDNGIPIKVIMSNFKYRGIDTVEDLKQLNL